MRKRIAATVIIAMIAGALCACSSGQARQEPAAETDAAQEQEAQAEAAQEQDVQADEAQGQEAQADAAQEQEAQTDAAQETASGGVRPAYVIMERNFMETEDDITLIASGSYETIQLTEEAAIAYPSLNKTVTALSADSDLRYKKYFEELEDAAELAREQIRDDMENIPVGEMEGGIEPVRCDEEVLSFFETTYTFYPGSAHGFTAYQGYNYDPASGNPITLEDVFTDPAALLPAVEENLRLQTLESQEIEAGEELQTYFGEGQDSLVWAIDEQGVTFLFAPSAIAPYAAGTIEAKISFAEYPDLFTGKYGPSAGGYARRISDYVPFTEDLDGDGRRETLSVYGDYSDGNEINEYSGIKVCVDDQELSVEQYFYRMGSYLLHTQDGRNYIYAVTTSDNDYQTLIVFDLSGGTVSLAGKLDRTGFGSVYHAVYEEGEFEWDESYSELFPILDPASFVLDTRMDRLSTYSAYRSYQVGSDGMPEPMTDYYEISADLELTSLIPLTAEKVDTQTGAGTGEEKELPAGTKCRLWHTNGEDTVDVMLEDGSAVRLNVEGTWPQTVNGHELDEAFSGTMFAG